LVVLTSALAPANTQPNILIVCADQMRASAMGCMGNKFVKTPHLDELATQGVLFTNAIAATPQCTAYRASLLTGRYGHHTGIVSNDLKLPHEEVTFAEILKQHGYATGFIGKWHLNSGRRQPKGTDEQNGFVAPGPDRQGFDFWAALECSHNYFRTHYFRDSPEPIRIDTYEPDVQTDLAIDFMRGHRNQPFCLVMMWGPPHSPYRPPEKWDIYDPADVPVPPNVPPALEDRARTELAQYFGLVSSLDENIGRLSRALHELRLAENTIVIFSSDHGDMLRSHGYTKKGRPQSEALHIPFIFRYPTKVKAGQVRDMPICSVDVMPTLLGFCGIDVPDNVDGLELSQVITGEDPNEPVAAFAESNLTNPGNSPGSQWRALRTNQYTYAISADGPWLLFDNEKDPYQLNNLIDDPDCRDVAAEFDRMMTEWRNRLGDTETLLGKVHTGPQPAPKRKSRNPKPSRTATTAERARSIISSRDKDGDGMLTYEEFNHGFTGQAAQEKLQRFTTADTNGDKLMTVEEFTVVLQKLGRSKKPSSR
jgi:arylsulfatase A-like enzyme